MRHQQPSCTLFPYTTLFRSYGFGSQKPAGEGASTSVTRFGPTRLEARLRDRPRLRDARADMPRRRPFPKERRKRSEEHTSELQSRENLVCRLLLEKKKIETS